MFTCVWRRLGLYGTALARFNLEDALYSFLPLCRLFLAAIGLIESCDVNLVMPMYDQHRGGASSGMYSHRCGEYRDRLLWRYGRLRV